MGATGADFSGYATKAGLRCSDGRTITPDAFKHMDGMQVPLVYQHAHNDINNVLGHAVLEARPDGMYTKGYFNGTPAGQAAKAMVLHGDLKAMSIYANQLVEKAGQVLHGVIREVSLVLAGANPGAKIDWVQVQHGDGTIEDTTDEAVITTGLELQHADSGDSGGPTVQDVYDSMNSEQQGVVAYMVAAALEQAGVKHSDDNDEIVDDVEPEGDDEEVEGTGDPEPDENTDNTDEDNLNHQEGADGMSRNVFEQNGTDKGPQKHVLTHDAMRGIMADAEKCGSLKEATEAYALKHGIENIEVLFPDAKNLDQTPQFNSRRMEWVPGVLNGTSHTPFSRVKTVTADITQDEARALGYIKGHYKKEEWFSVTKRTTGPTTVYKKQKLDRDDIIDITDFDVVAWMRREMRVMLEEELARAILIGDGRDIDDEDKIKDPMASTSGDGIRAIVNEHELFATTVNVNLDDSNSSYLEAVEAILRARRYYKGTGMPTFYTTEQTLTEMLLLRDEDGSNRRLFRDVSELAAAMRVSAIVPVEVMETMPDLVGIVVNLSDYNIGADKGGEVNLFDDFDIDYNQYKYLIETRISGALTKIKSALVVKKTAAANVLVTPTAPSFVKSTGVVTIPTKTGVVYKDDAGATLTAGAQDALAAGDSLIVVAEPASGYYFSDNASNTWTFKRPAA